MNWQPPKSEQPPRGRTFTPGCVCRACRRAVRCERARKDAEGRYTCARCQQKER